MESCGLRTGRHFPRSSAVNLLHAIWYHAWTTAFAFVISHGVTQAEPVEAVRPASWQMLRPPVEAPPALPPVPLLVEQLGSDKFAVRAAATRDLSRSGRAAVAALEEAALSNQPEVAIRALSALENVWDRAMDLGDAAAAGAALVAMDRLSAVEDPVVRNRVEGILISHNASIVEYAISEIQRLGGSVRLESHMSQGIGEEARPIVKYVIIGQKWTGGEEGLRHVKRVAPSAGVYFIYGTKVPEGTMQRFTAATGIPTTERGLSYLGVSGSTLGGIPVVPQPGIQGAPVGTVEPNTSAAKGGITPGDIITKFNGTDIPHWEGLVEAIRVTEPGQIVSATVIRQGEPLELSITMEGWPE